MPDARPVFTTRRIVLGILGVVVLVGGGLFARGYQLHLATLPDERPIDLQVAHPAALIPGGKNVLHCAVIDRRRAAPVAGARVEAVTRPAGGGEVALASGATDADGAVDLVLDAARIPLGKQTLRVRVTGSPLGTDEAVCELSGERPRRILLTTDKPLYQPDQVIHLRALAMDTALGRPVAGEPVTFEAEDAKGNKVFRRAVPSSKFGIAAADLRLADEINLGAWKLRAKVGETATEKTVTVSRYVLPKFKVELASDAGFYLPGSPLRGTLDAVYFFGKPVAGAEVVVEVAPFVDKFEPVARLTGRTDAAGHFDFDTKLPSHFVGLPLEGGNALLKLEAKVTDTAGHAETKVLTRVVAQQEISVRVVHESGVPVDGVANRYYVAAAYPDGRPAQTEVQVSGVPGGIVRTQTSAAGTGTFAWTPPGPAGSGYHTYGPGLRVQVRARDAAGHEGETTADLCRPVSDGDDGWRGDPARKDRGADGPARFLLRTDRALYRVGETLHLTLAAGAAGGRYTLDLVRGGQTMLTRLVRATGTETAVDLDLDAGLAGTLTVQAYRLLPDGNWARDRRVVYVDQPKDLEVAATLDRETHKPGETATVSFAVKGPGGAPEPAALSLAAVDEAVFALSENQPGLEKVYFSLEKEILEPKYQIKCEPVSIPELVRAAAPPPPPVQEAATVALAALALPAGATVASTFETRAERFEDERWTRGEGYRDYVRGIWAGVAIAVLVLFGLCVWFFPGVVLWKIRGAWLAVGWWVVALALLGLSILNLTCTWRVVRGWEALAQLVPWGMTIGNAIVVYGLRLRRGMSGWAVAGMVLSFLSLLLSIGLFALVGGGRAFNRSTAALATGAVTAMPDMAVPSARADSHFGGASEGPAAAAVAADRKASVRVRECFPETLFWRPELLTDDAGRATVSIPLADSITTWRLSTAAISAAGRLGGLDRGIRVFQDFFVDIDNPVALTEGDEVHLPVAVYNYLKEPQTVDLELEPQDWFENLDAPKKKVALGPSEVRAVTFGLRARKFGVGKLTVVALGSTGMDDAVRRSIRVLPNGEEHEVAASDRLAAHAVETLRIPDDAIDGASVLLFKLYPGTFSQVVDGLDRMVTMPYG